MTKSYAELKEMIKTLKSSKNQQIEELVLKLNHLERFVIFLINAKTYNIADVILTERIVKWKEYRTLNINAAKINRMLARVQQAFMGAKETTLELDLLEKCENLDKTLQQSSENMDQTLISIAQLISIFETEEKSENNALKLEGTIEQANLTFQANFNEILEAIQGIEEHYKIFIKIIEEVERVVFSDIRQFENDDKKKKMQQNESHQAPLMTAKLEDPETLDDEFCNAPRKPKQSRKEAYITALKIWVENKNNFSAQKIVFANYLFQAAKYHPLAKEKRYRPFCVFSTKTTSMATAQGLLAYGLSDKEKQQLLFNEKYLKRKSALEAYHEEIGFIVKKAP